jgi:hypothetical protein
VEVLVKSSFDKLISNDRVGVDSIVVFKCDGKDNLVVLQSLLEKVLKALSSKVDE